MFLIIAVGYVVWKGVSILWWPMISGQAYESTKLTSPRPIVIVTSDESVELESRVRLKNSTIKRLLRQYEKLDAVERKTYTAALTDIEEYVLDCVARRRELTELVAYIRVRSIESEVQRYRILDANRFRKKSRRASGAHRNQGRRRSSNPQGYFDDRRRADSSRPSHQPA